MPKELDTTSRVIIIGNSSSILLHKYGELIDSYDVVIRLNRCVTKLSHEINLVPPGL